MSDQFFAMPAFKPDEALLQLKRSLRDLSGLAASRDGFSLRGRSVIELSVAEGMLQARIVKRPAHSPEWEVRPCKTHAEVRAVQDEIKRRLARWMDETT